MARFDLHDIKRQASFFLRQKFKDARLALTDVSPTQLLTEEATNADPWGPETRTMAMLSDAAYELEEYERIVRVLHSRLEFTEKRPWRQVYKTLVVLEYLLMHGPGSLCNEFRCNLLRIEELCQFNFIDQQCIDRGLSVRKKADRVLELLNKTELWKEERNRAQKISHGIKGFGSDIKRETVPVAVESLENQALIEDSRVEEAETPSTPLLLDVVVEEERKANTNVLKKSKAEWVLFEKRLSAPMDFRQHDLGYQEFESKPSSLYGQESEFVAPCSTFKKSFSSPSHFRTDWQPFANETSKMIDTEAHVGDSRNNVVCDLVQDSEGRDEEFVTEEREDLQEVESVRRLQQSANTTTSIKSRGIEDVGARLPVLPPPPRPKFATAQPPSLI